MAYRTERTVFLDQKMIIEGVQYHEKKEAETVFKKEDGAGDGDQWIQISMTASHMQSIGEKYWKGRITKVFNSLRITLTPQNIDDEFIYGPPDETNMTKVWIL